MNNRKAVPADYPDISTLLEEVFANAAEAKLVDMLRRDDAVALEMVATDETDKVVGHILFSWMQQPQSALGLAPMAVTKTMQRTGIGTALARTALDCIKNTIPADVIFVLGQPDYYTRFEFSLDKAARFKTDYPKNYFMALELRADAIDKLTPVADYAKAFAAL